MSKTTANESTITRLAKFSFCSLALHLAAIFFLSQGAPFEHGTAHGINSAQSALTVRFVTNDPALHPDLLQKPRKAESESVHLSSIKEVQSKTSSPETNATGLPNVPDSLAEQDYLIPGQLTRLPTPVTDIDLNAPELDEIGFAGKAELNVLIDADGKVADVLSSINTDVERAFIERIAARFKTAHFIPGEINGKAVKSQLKITVVSESSGTLSDQ